MNINSNQNNESFKIINDYKTKSSDKIKGYKDRQPTTQLGKIQSIVARFRSFFGINTKLSKLEARVTAFIKNEADQGLSPETVRLVQKLDKLLNYKEFKKGYNRSGQQSKYRHSIPKKREIIAELEAELEQLENIPTSKFGKEVQKFFDKFISSGMKLDPNATQLKVPKESKESVEKFLSHFIASRKEGKALKKMVRGGYKGTVPYYYPAFESLVARGDVMLEIFRSFPEDLKDSFNTLMTKVLTSANYKKHPTQYDSFDSTAAKKEKLKASFVQEFSAKDVLKKFNQNSLSDVETDNFFYVWNTMKETAASSEKFRNPFSNPRIKAQKFLKSLKGELDRRVKILRLRALKDTDFIPSRLLLFELAEICGENDPSIDSLTNDQKREAVIILAKTYELNTALTNVKMQVDSLENADLPGSIISLQAMIDSKLSQIRKSYKILGRYQPSVDHYPGKIAFDQLKKDIDKLQQRFDDIVPEEPKEPHPDDIPPPPVDE
ncbi:MAG: hypothetical protein WDZ27_06485 [Waddliaceae bacterium]